MAVEVKICGLSTPETVQAAVVAGADILVIGRAITGAADPARAARDILGTLHGR